MTPETAPTTRERAERGQLCTLLGIGANVALVLGKGTAGVVGHSYALIAEAIEPPYSPDFAPIEQDWSKLKTALRTALARTRQALEQALDQAVAWITSQDAQNWFDHCGYHVHQL